MEYKNHKIKDLVGEFRAMYIAKSYDQSIRNKGSSGGVITSLLLYALKNKIVDGVVCVGYKKKKKWQYEVKIVDKADELINCAGSKYIKISTKEFLDVLNNKGKNYKRLAITGVNCNIAPLKRLKKKYDNISLIFGLFCGWCISYEATEYLLKKLGIKKKKEIKKINYRGGDYPGGFTVEFKDGKIKTIPKDYYDFINLIFVPNPCLDCKFYMAEDADISFGDAWIRGKKKYSTVIIRTKTGEALFNQALKKKKIIKEDIDYKTVIDYHWQNIKHKKIGDSVLMKILIKSMNNKMAPKIVPFRLFGKLATIRRKVKDI